jgi:hypothetical protein
MRQAIFGPRPGSFDLHLQRKGLKNIKIIELFPMKNLIEEVRKI